MHHTLSFLPSPYPITSLSTHLSLGCLSSFSIMAEINTAKVNTGENISLLVFWSS